MPIDELHRQLAEALRIARTRLIGFGINQHGPTLSAVTPALAAYDDALAAESAAHEQATAKLMGVDDDGQHGVGA